MNTERLTYIEIESESGGTPCFAFHAYSVPGVGDTVHWESKFKVLVLARAWIIDKADNPRGSLRCVLTCRAIVWNGKPLPKNG